LNDIQRNLRKREIFGLFDMEEGNQIQKTLAS